MPDQSYPTMFHYLFEMHKDGKSLMKLELNVPIAAFPAVKMGALMSLETMIKEYGESQGYSQALPEKTVAEVAT
mgnify:CR=1 FL=1